MKCGVPRLKEQSFTGELGEVGRRNVATIAGVAINPLGGVDVDLRQAPAATGSAGMQSEGRRQLPIWRTVIVDRHAGTRVSTACVVHRGLHVVHEEYNKVRVGSFLSLLYCVVLLLHRPGWPRISATTVEAVRKQQHQQQHA